MALRNATLPLRPVTLIEAFYKGMQVFLEMFSEFLQEIAALVMVFIPLDLWKNDLTPMRAFVVLCVSVIIFVFGLFCRIAAIAVKRARDLYEEEKRYEPSGSS